MKPPYPKISICLRYVPPLWCYEFILVRLLFDKKGADYPIRKTYIIKDIEKEPGLEFSSLIFDEKAEI